MTRVNDGVASSRNCWMIENNGRSANRHHDRVEKGRTVMSVTSWWCRSVVS